MPNIYSPFLSVNIYTTQAIHARNLFIAAVFVVISTITAVGQQSARDLRMSADVMLSTDLPMLMAINYDCPGMDDSSDISQFVTFYDLSYALSNTLAKEQALAKLEDERRGGQCFLDIDTQMASRIRTRMNAIAAQLRAELGLK